MALVNARHESACARVSVPGVDRRVGGRFNSPFTNDGLADEWDDDQRLRAEKYKRLAGPLATELDQVAAASHDSTLRWMTGVAANVAKEARSALSEGRPSPAVNVFAAVVEDVEKVLDSWLRDPTATPVLSGMAWDWYDEIREPAR